MERLTELFCLMADFCRWFEPAWERRQLSGGAQQRRRHPALSGAEWMTRVVLFHPLRFRHFKCFYLDSAGRYRRPAFPTLPSSHRCVELWPRCAAPLAALVEVLKGSCDGIARVDAPPLAVCDHRRIARHRGFTGSAARGNPSRGWFEGFKLHALLHSQGQLIRLKRTPGNGDDRKPHLQLCKGLFGQRFADKGDLAQWLLPPWAAREIQLITTLTKKMKPAPRTAFEKALLRRRGLIDTVVDELKHLGQMEHPRPRSVGNFLVQLMAGIVAYCLSDHKPTLNRRRVNALAAP